MGWDNIRVLACEIKRDAESLIRAFSHQEKCEIIELNVQIGHVHLLVMIPPKISISSYVGKLKGRVPKFKSEVQFWSSHKNIE